MKLIFLVEILVMSLFLRQQNIQKNVNVGLEEREKMSIFQLLKHTRRNDTREQKEFQTKQIKNE